MLPLNYFLSFNCKTITKQSFLGVCHKFSTNFKHAHVENPFLHTFYFYLNLYIKKDQSIFLFYLFIYSQAKRQLRNYL